MFKVVEMITHTCLVSEILQVFCPATDPHSTRILRVFPLDEIADVEVSPSTNFKLISRKIKYFNLCTDGRTDWQTDRQTDG